MKRVLKKMAYVFCVPLVALFLLFSPVFVSKGATMSSAYVMLSRMAANLDTTSDLEIYIAFRPSQAVTTGGTLSLEFPDDQDGSWCRVDGVALIVDAISSMPADSTGTYTVGASLPGTLTATCNQGSGTGSADTIEVTGVGALNSTTTYGLKISNGTTASLGTGPSGVNLVTLTVVQGSTRESKTFGLNIVSDDQVLVSAEVLDPPTITCSLSTNSVNLGNLYAGGTYVTGSHTLSASTSDNAAGYYWAAYGKGDGSSNAGLYKSTATTYLIPSNNLNSTVDISVPSSEGFGMNVEPPSGEAVAGTGFGDNSDGVFGTLGMGIDNAELISYRNWGPQTTTADTTIIYGARAGSSAVPGTYSETVTFICGGYIGGYESEPTMGLLGSPSSASSEPDSGGTASWINPANAQNENDTYTYSQVGTGGTCLAHDTLIWTEEGQVSISELEVGDMVYSYNLDTESIELSEVGNVVSSPIVEAKSRYYNIYYGDTYVRATYNHRFFVDGEYILAEELKVGDHLLDFNNQGHIITDITVEDNSVDTVWDLSVNGNHNFFANGVLVHNAGVYDDKVRIIKGGSVGSTDRAVANAWQSTPTTTIYGGPTDLWGQSWTVEDLNASNFGVAISTNGSGYTTDSISEYLKTTNFGLSIPSGSTIQGIEVRVRKRLRSGSNVYSDIDYVKVRVYYEESVWTLNFGNTSSPYPYSNVITIPEDVDLYLEWIPDDSYTPTITISGASYFEVNSPHCWFHSYFDTYWSVNTMETFSINDQFALEIRCSSLGLSNSCSGEIIIRKNDSEGTIISNFTYYDNGEFEVDPCPS